MSKRTKNVKAKALKPEPRKVNVGTGVDLVVNLPLGSIDPQFVEEMIGDIRAAYERALDRSWERFDRALGRKAAAK
jgi:hypothetical protein